MSNHLQNTEPQIYGLILAGGKSSRMGTDKGLIDFHGKPQREYLFDLLTPFCSKVFTSCKENSDIPSFLNPLADRFKIESPLNGILTAFSLNATVAWLTIPVDMPLIDSKTIAHLISNRDKNCVATCFFDSDGENPEPLVTLWEPSASLPLLEFYNSGKISPRDFLKQSVVNIIKIQDVKNLLNINSPEELEELGRKKTPI